jgi:NAD(P)H-quinone oxidoreductase subunit 5
MISEILFVLTIITPAVGLAVLGLLLLVNPRISESLVSNITRQTIKLSAIFSMLLLPAVVLHTMGIHIPFLEHFALEGFRLVQVGEYHVNFSFVLHPRETVFLVLASCITYIIAVFASTYLHREKAFNRFHLLLLVTLFGTTIIATAEGLDVLMIGWEFLGVASILLIAFYGHRDTPLNNALSVYRVYRIADIGMMIGIILLHHFAEHAGIHNISELNHEQINWVMGFIVLGAMGKGAIFPFSYWLPKGMEGPTPSSAVFYGSVSVHLSPLLLLRVMPELHAASYIPWVVIGLGAVTALYGTILVRVQSDVKASIAFATITQIGLIWMEIGMGWYNLAIVHIVANAAFRAHQILRAPSVLQERNHVMQSKRARIEQHSPVWVRVLPTGMRHMLYTMAIERLYLEELWNNIIYMFLSSIQFINNLEEKWRNILDGEETSTQPKGEKR